MEQEQRPQATSPHVLIFPVPAQGHVNSMLKLAELLALAGLKITFLNSQHNHERLICHTDIRSRFIKYPGFEFETITDGLPVDHPRVGDRIMEIFDAMELRTKPILREMLVKMKPPVDCIIGDGILGFIVDVANELGIPIFQFRTISACCIWAYFSIPDMIQAGELPIKGFEFETIWDGLPRDHPRSGFSAAMEMLEGLELRTKPIFRDMLVKIKPPVDCIIGDGLLGFIVDVADELGIPILQFRTIGASCIWSYFFIPDMIQAGELPIKGQ
ncbi:UDP-glucuronosyl/UDP-glucosyltransferase [Corchorus capsularis]|uniref:UDP-glucuronosyl/UDP-glucosyltransferase n=1 Tax=Corchorus capsularis TaxID=210143 RepID=A0A1R3HDN7_COCAP|nr:UDP-glucuronosyl/UDP-glucosyltransferase [Corchorus capsularis]